MRFAVCTSFLAIVVASVSQEGVAVAQENAAQAQITTANNAGAKNAAYVWHATDDELLAIQAARLDADARLILLKEQHDEGRIDEVTLETASREHARATTAYFTLVGNGGHISAASADNYQTQLFSFTASPRSVGGPSVLASAKLRRGQNDSILVDAESFQASLDGRVQLLRAGIPNVDDTRPLNAYLDQLRTTSTEAASASQRGGFIAFERALEIASPIQKYQLTMASTSAWQLRLTLRTTPSQASVVFTTPSGYRADFTTDTSRTTMRGLVNYTVEKAGYKTIRATNLDLVNAVEGTFTCVLIPLSDKQPAQACNIK